MTEIEKRVAVAMAALGCDGYDWREYVDNGMAAAAIAAIASALPGKDGSAAS